MMTRVSPSNIGKLLGAIEVDLRKLVNEYLQDIGSPSQVLGKELYTKCVERLKQEIGANSEPNEAEISLHSLLPYADFGDLYHVLNHHKSGLSNQVVGTLRDLTPYFDRLVGARNRVAHNRPILFEDCSTTEAVVETLTSTLDTLWTNLATTISDLESSDQVSEDHCMYNLPIPDYEETGYIGRRSHIEQLTKLCMQSPYPVITVIGDGGVGKSALALKVAYDMISRSDCPFEAIIWTTSKTKQLTPQEITRIEHAIQDSLGVFTQVVETLAPKGMNDPSDEVLEYLRTFRILLILDNLETVLDERIRNFLKDLPQGSKVLITSRIGLGAYEYPFKLDPLDVGESIQLLRTFATIRQTQDLVRMPNSKLESYIRRMKNNPLFIKWFVSAVQTGRRPEEILEQRDLFLEFCMSNVYEYLGPQSRKVLSSLLCLPGKRSQAELALLNDMSPIELEEAIQQLRTTTMVSMSSSPKDTSFQSHYELSELARDYLKKHHPVKPEDEKRIERRRRQLVATSERMHAEQANYPYSLDTIAVRSHSDVVIAKYLKDALGHSKREEFDEAESAINQAHSLAPDYSEVYRIEAIVKVAEKDYSAADTAYETAIELNQKSASLRYWYGGFLMRQRRDTEGALRQFSEAASLDPTSPEIQMEIARANLYLGNLEEARDRLDALVGRVSDLRAWMRRKVYDLHLQYFLRKADNLVSQRDKLGAFQCLLQLRDAYQSIPSSAIDSRTKETLRKAVTLAENCASFFDRESGSGDGALLVNWLRETSGPNPTFVTGERIRGTVARLVEERMFGFLQGEDDREYYFSRSGLLRWGDWNRVQVGSAVRFTPGDTSAETWADRPPAASNITLEADDAT